MSKKLTYKAMTPEERKNRPWIPEEDDRVLDLWLTGFGKGTISDLMMRTDDAIRVRVQKLATGYEGCRDYKPGLRRPRGGVLSPREIEILEWGLYGMGETRDNPVDAAHMARILNRPIEDIIKYQDSKRSPAKGFGIGK